MINPRPLLIQVMDQSDDEPDHALIEIVWFMEDCDEAIETFDGEFYQCPVCLAIVDRDGVLTHEKKIH